MPKDIKHEELLRIDGELERLSRSLVGAQADVDDDRQEAWLSVTEGAADQAASLFGWLSRAIQFRGMRRRRDEATRRVMEARSQPNRKTESAQDILERSEVRMRLIKAVSSLKAPYRQTITLFFFEGLDSGEVARVMGVPLETVRTRTRRALELLRQQLDAEYGSRETWALALIPAAMLFESATTTTVISEFLRGAAVMSGKAKIAMAAGFILVVAATIYQFTNERTDSNLDMDRQEAQEVDKAQIPRRTAEEEERAVAETKAVAKREDTPSAKKEALEIPRNRFGEEVGRLELTITYGKGGPAAADIPVTFLPFSVTDPFFREETFRTDRLGSLILEAYPAGKSLVRTIVGGSQRIKIKAGATTKATLVIPIGSRIVGSVLTPEGKPVVGAEIVTGEFGSAIKGEPITTTGTDGRFVIPNFGVNSIGLVGARANGHLPSALVMVFPSKGDEKKLDLVLGGPPSRLIIEVVSTDGEAVVGARCIAGKFESEQFSLPDGNKGMKFGRTDSLTDDNGKIFLENLYSGELEFAIRGHGFAAHKETITISEEQTTHHRVVLTKGGVIAGVITGTDGLPLGRVQVNAGRYGSLDSHFMRTNAKGEFRFENVVLGKVAMSAEKDKEGEARDSVVVTLSEPAIWNVQLKKPEGFVQGIVLDDAGNPIEGMSVSVLAMIKGRYVGGFDRSDKNGRFKITGLEADTVGHTLEVRAPKNNVTLFSMGGVKAGPELVRVVLPSDAIGAGTLMGRIVGKDGRPVGGATLSATRRPFVSGGGTGVETADGDGRFIFKDIPPGPYRISMRSPKYGSQTSDEKVVLHGQTVDVGDIVMSEPAFVKINSPGLGVDEKGTVIARSLDGGSSISIKIEGPSTLSQPLAPGQYRLKIRDREMATRTKDVNLEAGHTVEVTLPMNPGRPMTFSFPKGSPISSCTFKLLDAGGKVVASGTREKFRSNPLTLTFTLGVGSYTLEVEDDAGRSKRLILNDDSKTEQVLSLD